MYKIDLKDLMVAFLVCGVLLKDTSCDCTCQPAEEGQPYSILCQIPIINNVTREHYVNWQTGDSLSDFYCQCKYEGSATPCDCSFKQGVGATISASGSVLTTNFTIYNPRRGQRGTAWTCASSGNSFTRTCNFVVFVKAKNITCEIQDLEPTRNTDVTVRCQTQDIFPDNNTGCLFYTIDNNNLRTNLTAGTSGVTVDPGNKNCTLRVPGTYLGTLGRGDYKFGVVMYPSVTGGQTDKDYGEVGPDTTSVNIDDPSAELSGCPTAASNGSSVLDDYIREGTNHTCTCTRTDQTYFPVDISWVGHTEPSQVQSTDLIFTATRNLAYTCNVTNSLQWTKVVLYRPQVAYGPSSVGVVLKPTNQGAVDLCQAGGVNVTVQCQVSSPGVVPSATFSYTLNTTGSVVSQSQSDVSTSVATVRVTQGGTCGITCHAKNFKFEGIQTQNTVSVVVREPPSAPIIEISQSTKEIATIGDILTVEEGGADVKCHVIGGYPPQLTGLRLSCGKNQTFTNPGNQAQMNVNFTRVMNGANCSCVAKHSSTCYSSNTVSHMLNVLYPPSVLAFSADGSKRNVTVEKDSTLTFVCEADGNPGPGLSLQHDGSEDVTSVADGDTTVTTLTHDQTMDCLDTGVYTCTALAQGGEDRSTVDVYVLCPQQLEGTESQYKVYEGQVNRTFNINVSVYGYPKPASLQLHGHNEDLQENDYNVTYTETRPPHGIVKLTLYSLTERYFQNYTLTVTNGKESLVYYFSISGDVEKQHANETDNIAAIAGGIAAGVLVILVIGLVVFIVRRKGVSCGKKQDSSRKSDDEDVEHVIPNDLYSGRSGSGEVVVDNSDLYSGNWNRKSNEVVIDNSDLYSGFSKQGSNEVVVDNSALYGKSDDFKATREALYKNYADVTTSITSATAAPVRDMKASNGAGQGGNNSYEDVEVGAKSPGPSVQPKPKVAVKPMTTAKPTPAPKPSGPSTSAPQGAFALQNDGGDQTYASVIKTGKSQAPKTQPASQRESDFFPDQSQKPEVPEKRYEQEETQPGQEGKRKGQKKSGADKKNKNKNKKADEIPMVPQDGAAAT